MHDYVVLYAKSKNKWQRNLRPRDESSDEDYDNPDNDPNGPWISHALQSRNFYSKGIYSIKCPGGRAIDGPPPVHLPEIQKILKGSLAFIRSIIG